MGGRRSHLVTLFSLSSSLFLLSVTADAYVECTDSFPDAVLDLLGLVQIPVKDPGIPSLFIFLVINLGLIHNNHPNLLLIYSVNTSTILSSTVIRI
jgi:hypothetical protein